MPHEDRQRLADLEELSLSIPNQAERHYFNESVQCYFSGALRAAIVLSWIVATDNLLSKLELLAKEDGEAAKRLKTISDKRAIDQAYEEETLNAFGPGALDVFTQRELNQLQFVRQKRHWCAHATDYRPTPEEARTCLRLVVDIALSRPTYRGFAYIKQLESDTKDPAFLPARGYASVVISHISKLRPELHMRIVQKLLDVALDSAATSITKENVRRFIGAMLEHTDDEIQLQSIIKDLARAVMSAADLARGVIGHRPDVYQYLEFENRERLFRFLLEGGLNDEDQTLLINFMRVEFHIDKHVEALMEQMREKILLLPHLVKQNPRELARLAFEVMVAKLEYLGTNNYAINNLAAAFLMDVGFEPFDELKPDEKERLMRALIMSAIDGANTPTAFMTDVAKWPERWLELLVTSFPKIITESGVSVRNLKLFTAPLEAWADKGQPIPKAWNSLLILPPVELMSFPWYAYPDDQLVEQMESIDKVLAGKGNESPELKAFVERVRKDLQKDKLDMPF
jgi:hypothetical protein